MLKIAASDRLGMQFVKRFLHRDALGDVDAVLYRMEANQVETK